MGWVSWIIQTVYCHHRVKGRGVRAREDWSRKWSVMQEEARKGLRMQVAPETEKSRR